VAKVVFMGSDEFSVPALLALTMTHEVVGVVTQPDRPAGRGRKLAVNPVKRMAQAAEIPVYQPDSLRTPEALAQLEAYEADLFVVAAFGRILTQQVLDIPPHACVNIHASLLPRWRGAAPMPAAILAGDSQTGITIMKMDAGLDTGPILAQLATIIEVDDTAVSLGARLAEMGAQCLIDTLPPYLDGNLAPRPQPDDGVTFAPRLKKKDGWMDWSKSAQELDRLVRAYSPWPSAFTFWNEKRLKVLETIPLPDWSGAGDPGTVVEGEVCPLVVTGKGALWLTRVQLAGKKAMSSDSFICGQPDFLGAVLA